MKKRRLSSAALLALCVGATSPNRAAAITVLFHDALTSGKSKAKVVGGKFEKEGWKSVGSSDQLYYLLPAGVLQGSVDFDARGFQSGKDSGDPRQHIWGLYDVFRQKNDVKDPACACNGFTLRFYCDAKEKHRPGETRFRLHGARYKRRQADTPPLDWDPDRWYHFQITWTQTASTWKRDGKVIGSLSYPDNRISFRHLYINNDNHHVFKGAADIVYRNVVITDDPAFRGSLKAYLNRRPYVAVSGGLRASANAEVLLEGKVWDDGLPIPPGKLTVTWSQVRGPGQAVFADTSSAETAATFPQRGSYVLSLAASDGKHTTSRRLLVTVKRSGK